MILVLLGTQHNEFVRLLKEIEKCIDKKVISEEVIVQAGFTKYESEKMKIFDMISSEELNEMVKKSNLIITHGGVGSITIGLKNKKKIIAVPRLEKYKEHVNDHQKEIIKTFNEKGYLIGIEDVSNLEDAIKKSKDFNPKEYINNNNNILNIVEKFIDNL